jgi:hypothetical protein
VRKWHPARVLLIVPFVAVLWVPWFNRSGPTFWGFPMFYWYQLLWIILSGAVIGVVYLIDHRSEH